MNLPEPEARMLRVFLESTEDVPGPILHIGG